MARPSDYTPELAERICDAIADRGRLSKICAAPDMPNERTIYRWLEKYPEFCQQFTRARLYRAEARFDDLEELHEQILSGDLDANAGRVLIDLLKWQMGKENPKVYGDKTVIAGDADAPLAIQSLPSPDDIAKRVAFLLVNKGQDDDTKALPSP